MKLVVPIGHCATRLWAGPGEVSRLLPRARLEDQIPDAVVWVQIARTYYARCGLLVIPPFGLGMGPMVEADPCPDSLAELVCCFRIDQIVSAQMNLYRRNDLSLLGPFRARRTLVHDLKRDDMESDLKI